MDYEEFNKEYKKYEMWNDQMDFNEVTGNLLWGKQNGIPQIDFDSWTGQEDRSPVEMFRGSAKNNIQSTGFIPDDRVNSPSHYTSGRMEAIDIIEDAISTAPTPGKGLLQAQVLKYILRLWLKDSPVEDAKKAEWYLRRLIDSLE